MCPNRQESGRARPTVPRGFTLVELLVVISIMALLLSIILPSFQRARAMGRTTVCRTNLRSTYLAQSLFLEVNHKFQPLNNEEEDGKWQYNYLIYDGRDWENFGLLANNKKLIQDIKLLYCPFQKDDFHSFDTSDNPWHPNKGMDTRASYARRHLISGRQLSDFKRNFALFSDVFHMPKVIRSGHKNGVNAAYLDGHVSWILDRETFLNNELGEPFDILDNPIVEEIWLTMDRHQ